MGLGSRSTESIIKGYVFVTNIDPKTEVWDRGPKIGALVIQIRR